MPPLDILLVEDNPADAGLVREALKDVPKATHLHVLPHAQEAIAFLRREGSYLQAPRPTLILLDIHMPFSGYSVLDALTDSPRLHDIPAVIFSGSANEEDKMQAYAKGAQGYIDKNQPMEELFQALTSLVENLPCSGEGQTRGTDKSGNSRL